MFVAATIWAKPGSTGNSVCAQWCSLNYANPGKDCTSLAAQGGGPCYKCGPLKTVVSMKCCNEKCCNTDNDDDNCGDCGKKCPSGEKCKSGKCV